MDVEDARQFLQSNHRGILITRRRDGSPQGSPVAVAVDDAGRVMVSTRETAMKARNLARDPRASVVVFTDGFYGPWIQIDGTAEIVALPEAMDGLIEYYRRASGNEHPDWDEYRQAMATERRVLVRISMDRVGPNVSG